MIEKKAINSHIQMLESVLRRFENQYHQYYYYDVRNGFIGNHGHAGKTNTQHDFYSSEAEDFLSANVETPFGDVLKMVDEISIEPPRGHIDSLFDYAAKRFVYALVARNPDNIDRIKEYPFLTDFLSERDLRDARMMLGFAPETEREFLAGYGTTIAVNMTEMPFILSTCGAYYIQLRGIEHIVLPVSPEKAIVFVEEKGKDAIIHDGIVHPYCVDDVRDVQVFNEAAFTTQCRYGNGYVVSPSRAALENALQNAML